MKGLILIFTALILSACAANHDEKTTVTGTRVSKSDFKDGELKAVKPKEGENIFDMLMRVQGAEGMPAIGEFKDCKELLAQLAEKKVKVDSIKKLEVVAITATNKKFTYNFKTGNCLG